jgi:hypothetical protein
MLQHASHHRDACDILSTPTQPMLLPPAQAWQPMQYDAACYDSHATTPRFIRTMALQQQQAQALTQKHSIPRAGRGGSQVSGL